MGLLIEDLKVALKDKQLATALALLHQIKGSASTVGGMALSNYVLSMEKTTKKQDVAQLKLMKKELGKHFNLLKIAMKKK